MSCYFWPLNNKEGGNAALWWSLPLYNLLTFYKMFENTVNELITIYFLKIRDWCIFSLWLFHLFTCICYSICSAAKRFRSHFLSCFWHFLLILFELSQLRSGADAEDVRGKKNHVMKPKTFAAFMWRRSNDAPTGKNTPSANTSRRPDVINKGGGWSQCLINGDRIIEDPSFIACKVK